jgi:hypothetical protein
MDELTRTTSACQHCRSYAPEGRRGGHCQQLGVPVGGSWKACSLAIPPFAPSWEHLEQIAIAPWDQSPTTWQAPVRLMKPLREGAPIPSSL